MPSAVRAAVKLLNISGPGKLLLQTEVNCLTRVCGWYSPWHFHSADFRPRPPNVSDNGCGLAGHCDILLYIRLSSFAVL